MDKNVLDHFKGLTGFSSVYRPSGTARSRIVSEDYMSYAGQRMDEKRLDIVLE